MTRTFRKVSFVNLLLFSSAAVLLFCAYNAQAKVPEFSMASELSKAQDGLLELVKGKRNSAKFLFAFNRVWDAGRDALAEFGIRLEAFAHQNNFQLVMKVPPVGSQVFVFILNGLLRTVEGLSPLGMGVAPEFLAEATGTVYMHGGAPAG